MASDRLAVISQLFPFIAIIVSIGVAGWVITTWMRIKHGYPLDGAWGQAVYPKAGDEAMERIRLLSSENAQLRAELGSIKDRLATIELWRVRSAPHCAALSGGQGDLPNVTDDGHRLTQEIEALRLPKN